MAGAMRKMGIYLGLVEEDEHRREESAEYSGEYAGDYGEYPNYASDARPAANAVQHTEVHGSDQRSTVVAPPRRPRTERTAKPWVGPPAGSTAVGLFEQRAEAPAAAEPSYRITTLHPRTYNEARTIGEHFREGVPVIMNLTEMNDSDAKRLVDFAAGLSFGLRGSIERVTNKVFLLSPQNVSVTAEDKARIVEGGFFNQS